ILVNVVDPGGIQFVAASEGKLARRASELFADELSIDDLPDAVLVRFLGDVLAGLLARHEGAASTGGAGLDPNFVIAIWKERDLLFWFAQLGFGLQPFPFRLLPIQEGILGRLNAQLHSSL